MQEKNRSISLIVMAVVLGVIGMLLSMLYLSSRESALRDLLKPKSTPVSVVVASRDLVKGDVLDERTLAIREIPRDFVSDQAVRPGQFESVKGKVLQENLSAGQAVLLSFLGDEFPFDFSDTLADQRRAMTIQIDELNSFSGLLRPGNRIDLMVNSSLGSGSGRNVSPVLENVEVLATGRETALDYEEKVRIMRLAGNVRPDRSYSTITLNVSPQEAALITIAQGEGDLFALLRNRQDTSGSDFVVVSEAQIQENAILLAARSQVRSGNRRLSENVIRSEDGILRTRDGTPLVNQNLVVGSDGSIRTKAGIDLASRGLSVNSIGEIVTSDGKVVDPDSLLIAADGSLMTESGEILGGNRVGVIRGLKRRKDGTVVAEGGVVLAGVTLKEDGRMLLADGTVVDPSEVIINANGSVSTKDGEVLAGVKIARELGVVTKGEDGRIRTTDGLVLSGVNMDSNGNIVLPDGTLVRPEELLVNSDGTVSTKGGVRLSGITAGLDIGTLTASSGASPSGVRTSTGLLIQGAKLSPEGNLVLADGRTINPEDIELRPDGTLVTKAGEVLDAVSTVRAGAEAIGALDYGSIDYIVGGVSENSVAIVNKVPAPSITAR